MSDEDIDKAVKEAAEFEAQDKKRKEGIDAKNEADAMVFQTEKALQEVGDKLDGADKAAVEADCKALKELLEKQIQILLQMSRLQRSKQVKKN